MKLLKKKREAMKDLEIRKLNREQRKSPRIEVPKNKVPFSRSSSRYPKQTREEQAAQERHRKYKQLQATHSDNSLPISRASNYADPGLCK